MIIARWRLVKNAITIYLMWPCAKYEDGQPLSQTDAMANAFYPYVMNAIYTNRTNSYLLYELL